MPGETKSWLQCCSDQSARPASISLLASVLGRMRGCSRRAQECNTSQSYLDQPQHAARKDAVDGVYPSVLRAAQDRQFPAGAQLHSFTTQGVVETRGRAGTVAQSLSRVMTKEGSISKQHGSPRVRAGSIVCMGVCSWSTTYPRLCPSCGQTIQKAVPESGMRPKVQADSIAMRGRCVTGMPHFPASARPVATPHSTPLPESRMCQRIQAGSIALRGAAARVHHDPSSARPMAQQSSKKLT